MAANNRTYHQMSQELEELILWFESGEVTIDDAIQKYEQANKLIAEMEKYLKQAENKIRKISVKFNSPAK